MSLVQLLHCSDNEHLYYANRRIYSGPPCTDYYVSPLTTRYHLVSVNKNWTDAQLHCENFHHAKLVIIQNKFDQLRLHTFLQGLPGRLV